MNKTIEAILTEYMDPIYRFALKHLQNTRDAEDLAQEILMHVIKGILKYDIIDLNSWIWKVAHNRYNIFLREKYTPTEPVENFTQYDSGIPDTLEEIVDSELMEQAFLSLHSLSSMYRDTLVQYYVHENSVKQISAMFNLPESTVKWRIHLGKEKMKERIENYMINKVYDRINWWLACNGNIDSTKYLGSQMRRAICLTAYDIPKTIEDISKATGIPSMYIEDEISVLEYGDAIIKQNNKYAADFIILKKDDNDRLIKGLQQLVETLADKLTSVFKNKESEINNLNIPGITKDMKKLGYIITPLLLRRAIDYAKEKNGLKTPPFPPRKDGGNGWFIVEESTIFPPYNSGCNNYTNNNVWNEYISWFWIGKYFKYELNIILRHLIKGKIRIISNLHGFTSNTIDEETTAELLKLNLIKKCGNHYVPSFSILKDNELTRLISVIENDTQDIALIVEKLVLSVYESFKTCVPERLHSQILGVFGGYLGTLVGLTINELQSRGVLASISKDETLTSNIMYVTNRI